MSALTKLIHFAVLVYRLVAPSPKSELSFLRSALRAYTEAPCKTDILRGTLRALNRSGRPGPCGASRRGLASAPPAAGLIASGPARARSCQGVATWRITFARTRRGRAAVRGGCAGSATAIVVRRGASASSVSSARASASDATDTSIGFYLPVFGVLRSHGNRAAITFWYITARYTLPKGGIRSLWVRLA